MEKFSQLSYHERRQIYRGICQKMSKREMAKMLNRSPSTISREMRRNSDHIGYLYAGEAHQKTLERKNKNQSKIVKNPDLMDYIIEKLHERWSPNAISGRWNLEHNNRKISAEAIYQWIYSEHGEQFELKKLLIRVHKKRGLKRKPYASKIKNRISVHTRPEHINLRSELGHYEGDLIFNSGSQSRNILTLVERVTRQAILIKNENKRSGTVIDALIRYIKKTGIIIKSITFDNGSEFGDHNRLRELGIETYFCDPGSPWQKGSIENLNGFIRRFFPFAMPAQEITRHYVATVNDI